MQAESVDWLAIQNCSFVENKALIAAALLVQGSSLHWSEQAPLLNDCGLPGCFFSRQSEDARSSKSREEGGQATVNPESSLEVVARRVRELADDLPRTHAQRSLQGCSLHST